MKQVRCKAKVECKAIVLQKLTMILAVRVN